MSIKVGDTVRVKEGGQAGFHLFDSDTLINANAHRALKAAAELTVIDEADADGDIRVALPEQDTGGMVSRDQLQRKFAGDFWEGDEVLSAGLHITGVVVDRDPHAEGISRTDKVPVQVKTRGIYADGKLQVGEVVYTDPSYLRQAKNTPGQFPRVKLDGFYENIANAFGAFGGQGGQGGVAIGPGAVGGRGGNGGSAHIHVGAGGSPRPVQPPSNHQAPAGADLRADLASADKPTESPAYVDVTDKVRGSWAAVEVGDVVTATHRTERAGVAISNSRTSEVVYNRGYTFGADAGKHWCELQLSSHTRYDAYKITKVLRLQKQRLLSERRKPVEVTVTRLVPANHVWKPSYLTAKGNAYVEADQGGTYWLTFTDGDLAGKKLRLKEGRDTVTYTAIMGDVRVSGDFEQLVTITHSK